MVNLYQNLPWQLLHFKAGGHPGGFYLKMGFSMMGVMPDANGRGKPVIYFGKPL